MKYCFVYLLLGCTPLYAWNAEGHRIMAQIALNHMTPSAKARFQVAHPALDKHKKPLSFVESAAWLDTLRTKNLKPFGVMHYVDLPILTEGMPAPKPQTVNGLMALRQSRALLLENHALALERVFALRVLIHLVGDLHQPLHAATRVSRAYPHGDAGGNAVRLPKNKVAENLHAYWDRGGGSLLYNSDENNLEVRVRGRALALEAAWPCKPEVVDKNPVHWLAESHALAVSEAYTMTPKNFSTGTYQQRVSRISEKRLALSGCRLAAVLNDIDAQLSHVHL